MKLVGDFSFRAFLACAARVAACSWSWKVWAACLRYLGLFRTGVWSFTCAFGTDFLPPRFRGDGDTCRDRAASKMFRGG